MTHEEAAKAKKSLAEICTDIGCSKLSARCPGDPACAIIRKVVLK